METNERIAHALLQIAKREPNNANITLQAVAKEVGLSRQAIYKKHYKNVREIIFYIRCYITQEIDRALLAHPPKIGVSPFTVIIKDILPIVYKHRTWIHLLYTTSVDPSWSEFLEKHYENRLYTYLKGSAKRLDVTEGILIKILTKRILAIFSVWMSEEIPDTPEKFAEVFFKIVMLSPNDLIDKPYQIPHQNQ